MTPRHKLMAVILFVAGFAGGSWITGYLFSRQTTHVAVNYSDPVQVWYSPASDLEKVDLQVLETATKTIDMSEYAFTDEVLAREVLKKAKQGVKIRIYRDNRQFAGEEDHNNLTTIFMNNENVQIRVKHSSVLAHLKAYEVDGYALREGSANWSPSGEQKQDNSLILIHDKLAAAEFKANFESIWSRSDNRVIQ